MSNQVAPIDNTHVVDIENDEGNSDPPVAEKVALPETGEEEVDELDAAELKRIRGAKFRVRCNIFKAIFVRLLFAIHMVLAVWRATEVAGLIWLALLGAGGLLLIELIVLLVKRKGKGFKQFCPGVLFFLAASVPSIWILELHKFSTFNNSLNTTFSNVDTGGTDIAVRIGIRFSGEEWALIIEQSMMLILIIGRWLLPKGDLSRDELSALLLVYVGLAADIIELFEIFDEERVLKNAYFIYAVLGVWSWSLLQFVFIISASGSGQGTRISDVDLDEKVHFKSRVRRCCCNKEIWAIIGSVIMQDGPFLAIRLWAIIMFNVRTYSNYFFTAKNVLIIVLQAYRLVALNFEENDEDENAILEMAKQRSLKQSLKKKQKTG